jgi:hypothetical protein
MEREMMCNETMTDTLCRELRELDAALTELLTRNFPIDDVVRFRNGILPNGDSELHEEIGKKYRRMKELESALNAVL